MKHLKIITVLICMLSFNAIGKVRMIDIRETLKLAQSIKTITVYSYQDQMMFYGEANSQDTFKIDCKTRKISEKFRYDIIVRKLIDNTILVGKWPAIGETVLMVIDKNKRATLFAQILNDRYRFWDPNSIPHANSVFNIPAMRPYILLPVCKVESTQEGNYWTCSDGCLALRFDIDRGRF